MTTTRPYNGQIPTDPHTILLMLIAVLLASGRLSADDVQALIGVGSIAELAVFLLRLRERR